MENLVAGSTVQALPRISQPASLIPATDAELSTT